MQLVGQYFVLQFAVPCSLNSGAAASQYVAPKSMTLDMGKILQGDDVQKDVEALGILWIRIHKATGLSKQDRRGSQGGGSDPYITVSFSKYGKPMYCTRVIQDNCNPVWEETCALLVTPELIKADEQLSMELVRKLFNDTGTY